MAPGDIVIMIQESSIIKRVIQPLPHMIENELLSVDFWVETYPRNAISIYPNWSMLA